MAGELLHRAGATRIERCEQNVCRNTCGPACRGLRRDLEQPDHARHPVDLARPDIAVPALVECSSASIPRTTGRGPKGPGRVPVERAAARGSLSSDRRRRAEAPQSPSHQALATCVRPRSDSMARTACCCRLTSITSSTRATSPSRAASNWPSFRRFETRCSTRGALSCRGIRTGARMFPEQPTLEAGRAAGSLPHGGRSVRRHSRPSLRQRP
jgi:hypothetical protein